MDNKLKAIVGDGAILFIISAVIAILAHFGFSFLKTKGAKDDPIVTAIIQNDVKGVSVKAAKGAEATNVRDGFGRTALMRTAYVNFSMNDPEGLKALAKADGIRTEIATILLDQGAKIGELDNDGWTALMWAAWSGLPKVSNLLMEKGCPVNAADRLGNTALIIAAQRGNFDIVKALLAKNADKSAVNKAGVNALSAAETGKASYSDRRKAYDAVIDALR